MSADNHGKKKEKKNKNVSEGGEGNERKLGGSVLKELKERIGYNEKKI